MYELLPARSRRPVGPRVASLCPVPTRGVLPFAEDTVSIGTGAISMFTIIHHGDRASAEQVAQELLLTFTLSESGYCPDISVQPLHRQKHQIQLYFFEEVGDDIDNVFALHQPRSSVQYRRLHPQVSAFAGLSKL